MINAKRLVIYTDGGSRGNPGPSGIGVAVYNEKKQLIKEYSHYLGPATNNEAEYQAVIFALKKIKALFGKKKSKDIEIEMREDSELLVKQLRGEYKVLNSNIQALFLQVWNLRLDFKSVKFVYIPRENNKVADRLVNEALDSQNKTQQLL